MKIYQLTQLGHRLARSTTSSDTSNWRVIYALDKLGYGTPDQLALQTGLEESEVMGALGTLRRKGLIAER